MPDLDAALGLHQLQLGLRQLQLQLPQLLLQAVLLLVPGLRGGLLPTGGRGLEGARGAEEVPAVLAAQDFTLHVQTHHTHTCVSVLLTSASCGRPDLTRHRLNPFLESGPASRSLRKFKFHNWCI